MKPKFFLAFVLVIILILAFVIFFGGDKKITGKSSFSELEDNSQLIESQEAGGENNKGTTNAQNTAQTNEEPSTQNQEAQTNPNCAQRQISYSLSNFEASSICNAYSNSVCIDKTTTCYVTVTNLDFEVSGIFTILFEYFAQENSQQIINTSPVSDHVESRSSKLFKTELNLQNNLANKTIKCSFSTSEVPKKSSC